MQMKKNLEMAKENETKIRKEKETEKAKFSSIYFNNTKLSK